MNLPYFLKTFALLALSALLLTACDSDNDSTNISLEEPAEETQPADGADAPGNIAEVAVAAGSFETLVTALQAAGLDSVLADEDSDFTVFAPTDDAFAALPDGALDALLNDVDALSDVLLYHVIADAQVDADTAIELAEDGEVVAMANEKNAALTLRDGMLYINESTVIDPDVNASNGIIHVIDTVLLPPELAEPTGSIVDVALGNEDLETLVTALVAAGLVDTLADEEATFTVFAPTDDAFAALPDGVLDGLLADIDALTDVLTYHVVGGVAADSITATSLFGQMLTMLNEDDVTIDIVDGELFVNDAQVVIRDVTATNGIIHVIDAVLLPPEMMPGTIVDVAVGTESLSTLVTAVLAADLADTLSSEGPFTVFAPTDEAFAALPEGTLDALLEDVEALADVLLYHVIADAEIEAETAIELAGDGEVVAMANEKNAALTLRDGMLFINESMVTMPDVPASNGVVHVIDTVLLPPEMMEATGNIVEVAVGNEDLETLVTAVTAADLVDTLSDEEATFTVFAPTDAAFEALPDGVLDGLLADIPALTDVLLYHVVGDVAADSITATSLFGQMLTMLNEDDVTIDIVDGEIIVNDSTVIIRDVPATNGIIHVIDAVLLPPEA